jgi:hypothetical protein
MADQTLHLGEADDGLGLACESIGIVFNKGRALEEISYPEG